MIFVATLFALPPAELPTASRSPAYSLRDVLQHQQALDGKVIRVRGVVTECRHLDCRLREHGGKESRTLSIGTSDNFDRRIQSRLNQVVTVEARFDATCLIEVCTDRAPVLSDPRIVSNR